MSEQNQNAEQQNNQGGEDKIEKQFNSSFKKLIALMNGEKNLKKGKVPKGEVADVVAELIKEKKQVAIKEFKTQAVALLDKKVEFDKEVRKLEDEFKNKVNAKKKEFTESMQALFKTVEDIDGIEKSYYSSLGGGAAPTKEEAKD